MAKKIEKKPLKKGTATFQLIGEAKLSDYTYKLDEQSKTSDWVYNVLNLGVDCGNGNVVYADMMGGYGSERDNILYVHGIKQDDNKKNVDDYENKFTIDWDDRFDETILDSIGNQCFITVGLEKDKSGKTFVKKFLSQYDAIIYISEHLTDGMVVNVKGNIKYSIYSDNIQTKKEITSIFLSKIDDKTKYRATFTQSMLLDKDSVGKLDKEKAIYPIYARVIDYTKLYKDKEVKQNIPFAKTFELEVNKEKPEITKKIIEKILKVKKDIMEITLEGDIIEGQSLVTVSEDDIPDDIKDLIDCGIFTKEEALSKMAVGGSREKRMIIRKPLMKMIGGEDNKKLEVCRTECAYKEEDMFFDFMKDDEEEKEEDTTSPSEIDDEETGSDDDWLNKLDDEE